MKKMNVPGGIVFFILLQIGTVYGQSPLSYQSQLTPARGHYASLAKLNDEPSAERAEWDKLKFPFSSESAQKRLSRKPFYLTNLSLDDFTVPDHPANSSQQTRAELNYLLQLQQQRSKIDVDASLEMAGVFYSPGVKPTDDSYSYLRKNLFFIGRSMGTWFQPDSLPLTADLIANVWQDASYLIWSMKYKHLRIRPYKLDPRIRNLEETEWAAYPSGHATNSYVNAFIYQELAPEFADVFMKDAYDMAHSREILGVHYPSDSEAGRVLARQLVNKLFQNEKFLRDFEVVKKEWAGKTSGYYGNIVIEKTELQSTKGCGSPTTETKSPSACASSCAKTSEEPQKKSTCTNN
jgi:acid phosphatase (class A)